VIEQPRATPAAAARLFLRPIANPLPLGFIALAAATLLISGLQLGWLGIDQGQSVALILIAFVFPLQLLVSVLAYLARDIVAGTGMGILAGTWLSVALVAITSTPGSTSDALGLFLLLAAAAMVIPATAAAGGKLVPAAVLTLSAVRFLTTGVAQLAGGGSWEDAAGVVGLALCALALYAALALLIEDARRTTVLPLGRHGLGRAALADGFDRQLDRIEHEAGVREQL
jgi:succinate-acetate transporter protein